MFHLPSSLNLGAVALLCGLLLAGCAGKPELPPFEPPVYPPPPEEGRFIFERTLMGSSDVELVTRQERFKAMATGTQVGERRLIKPYGVAVRQGRIYVSDTVQRSIFMFDIPGKRFVQFGNLGPGILSKPIGLGISPQGDIFVADVSARRVVVYNAEGEFLRSFGGREEMQRPSDVVLSRDGRYAYVVDTGGVESREHHLLQYDAQSGELLKRIGTRGSAQGDFNLPAMATVDSHDRVYVLDAGNFRVQRFSPEGEFELSFGRVGNRFGHFSRPKGIAVDADDNVYVVDSSFANFQIFNENGELLLFIGERSYRNEPGKFSLPAGIHVDEDGRIYVVDQFFSKIDVFRPYGMKQGDGYAGVAPAEK